MGGMICCAPVKKFFPVTSNRRLAHAKNCLRLHKQGQIVLPGDELWGTTKDPQYIDAHLDDDDDRGFWGAA